MLKYKLNTALGELIVAEIIFENVDFIYPETENPVFSNLNLSLPGGIISLMGQNGTGKSTLFLLAGGTILPTKGKVLLHQIDTTELRDEKKRQEYVSFVFQNMEFETEAPLGDLLPIVYENGFHKEKKDTFIPELIKVFELEKILTRKTQEISKGELQRCILAFSLLYGSKTLILDEPLFAMEQSQKERSMEYLCDYSKKAKMSIFYSAHELEITEKYSEMILLFYKDKEPVLGTKEEIFVKEKIEEAYQVPLFMLKQRESLFRESLQLSKQNPPL